MKKRDRVADVTEQVADRKTSQADRIVQLITKNGVELFHDSTGSTWARIEIDGHYETWHCRSRDFKQWLARLAWEKDKKVPDSQAINAALNVIAAKGRFDGPERALHNRVASFEKAIWYDLANTLWWAVRVTPRGWEIEPLPPILFRRRAHQRPQVLPAKGGDLTRVLEFVNLRQRSDQILLLVYIVSSLVPDIPHPIPVLYGPQGATKTTTFCILRRLIDPSVTETLSLPRDATQLVQQLSHHWTPYYDNITFLPEWVSDALCRSVTGQGFSKRELFSDDDDVIYSFRLCSGLNGINIAAHKPDLLDRCLLFGLEPLAPEQRRDETELWAEFETLRPSLFGGMLDALSRAMVLRPAVHLPGLPRMADFAKWGCAIAEALGYSQEEFLAAYDDSMQVRNDEVLAGHPVAAMVAVLMEGRQVWNGTASELLNELDRLAIAHRVDIRSSAWPKAAHTLTRRLNEVRPNLAAAGIAVTVDRNGRGRNLTIRKTPQNSVTSVTNCADPRSSGPSADDATSGQNQETSQGASPGKPGSSGQGDGNDASDAPFQPCGTPTDDSEVFP
jgi:hypothetical protein